MVVRQINEHCLIVKTKFAEFDLDLLWNTTFERNYQNLQDQLPHSSSSHESLHKFLSEIDSFSLTIPSAVFARERLEVALGELLWEAEG
eukprot:CAMPEP_0202966484 /NCGR_PEP_ID=MMETSP1396-20130829/10922_1 /ASSEMBLY_ACC=CAM_ASM_000872 /TAXON_ID= /ORGANISM="Pseudokeronopsis sp., Strain Brazil" /LENGTH=88 /DNA_ID=CAMNT_0049690399 /DNA_START=401 /DNA_END=664 /DNA_ORIENTATION=-